MRDLTAVVAREDQIELELPASAEYGRVIRIAAANLALRRGFSLNEIDDLRLVMDEAAVMLLDPGLANNGQLEVTYSVGSESITIDLQVVSEHDQPVVDGGVERFGELVGDLVDDYTIDAATRRLTFTKTRTSP